MPSFMPSFMQSQIEASLGLGRVLRALAAPAAALALLAAPLGYRYGLWNLNGAFALLRSAAVVARGKHPSLSKCKVVLSSQMSALGCAES